MTTKKTKDPVDSILDNAAPWGPGLLMGGLGLFAAMAMASRFRWTARHQVGDVIEYTGPDPFVSGEGPVELRLQVLQVIPEMVGRYLVVSVSDGDTQALVPTLCWDDMQERVAFAEARDAWTAKQKKNRTLPLPNDEEGPTEACPHGFGPGDKGCPDPECPDAGDGPK